MSTTLPVAAHLPAAVVALRLVRWFAWCCLAWLVALWFALDVLGDRAWWTVPLLYGPRWVLVAPWLGVLPWVVAEFRRAAVPALIGLAVAVFPVMGTKLGLHRARVGSGVPFRVLELNADGSTGFRHFAEIKAEFSSARPDLIIIAECGPDLVQAFKGLPEYHVRKAAVVDLCLLSRTEILEWVERDPTDVWIQAGSGAMVRAVVNTPAGPVRVGLVHLETPRDALEMYFDLSELPKQGPLTRGNIAQRDEESGLARTWILSGPGLPSIIAGDFNLPVESAVYRRHWGDLRNAFDRAGVGTGYTKHTRHWGVRIDHILTTTDIGTHASFTGPFVGSDHLPLIADLVLPAPQRTSTAR